MRYALCQNVMSKSILLLTNAYPDFPSSYRGIFIKRTALQLQSEGWKVSVVTPKIFRESEYFEEEKGVRIFRFPFFAGDRLLIEYSKIPYLRMILYYITGTFLTLYVVLRYQCRLAHQIAPGQALLLRSLSGNSRQNRIQRYACCRYR